MLIIFLFIGIAFILATELLLGLSNEGAFF